MSTTVAPAAEPQPNGQAPQQPQQTIENPLHHLLTIPNWTIDTDEFLLDFLHDFANKYTDTLSKVQTRVDNLMSSLETQEVMMQNVMNEFDILKITQFMEHRVYDDHFEMPKSEPEKKELNEDDLKLKKQEEIRKNFIKSLAYGEEALQRYSVFKETGPADEEEDSDPFTPTGEATTAAINEKRAAEMAKIHEMFRPRKLPYLIGSEEFIEDEMCGLDLEEDPGVLPADTLIGIKKPEVSHEEEFVVDETNTEINAQPVRSETTHYEDQTFHTSQNLEYVDKETSGASLPATTKNFFEEDEPISQAPSKPASEKKTGDLFSTQYYVDDDDFNLDDLENQFGLSKTVEKEPESKPLVTIKAEPKASFSFFDGYDDMEDDLDDILNIGAKPKTTQQPPAPKPVEVVEEPKKKLQDFMDDDADDFGFSLPTKTQVSPAVEAAAPVEAKPAPAKEVKKPISNFFGDDDLLEDDDDLLGIGLPKAKPAPVVAPPADVKKPATGLLDDLSFDVDDFSLPVEKKPQAKPKPSFGAPSQNLFSGLDDDDDFDPLPSKPQPVSKPAVVEKSSPAKEENIFAPVDSTSKAVKSIDDLLAIEPKQTVKKETASKPTEEKAKPAPKRLASAFESTIMQGLMGGPAPKKVSNAIASESEDKSHEGGVSTRDKIEHLNLSKPRRAKTRRPVKPLGGDISSLPTIDVSDALSAKPAAKPAEKKRVEKKTVERRPVEKKPVEKKPVEKKSIDIFDIPQKPPAKTEKPADKSGLDDILGDTSSRRKKPSRKSAVDDEIFGSLAPAPTTNKRKNEAKSKAAELLSDDAFSRSASKPAPKTVKAPASSAKKTTKDDLFGDLTLPTTKKTEEPKKTAKKPTTDDLDDIFATTSSKKVKSKAKKSDDFFGF